MTGFEKHVALLKFHPVSYAVGRLFLQVESSDLIAYGLIPEFIGRFPVLVSLAALNEDQLVQVLCSHVYHFEVYWSLSHFDDILFCLFSYEYCKTSAGRD